MTILVGEVVAQVQTAINLSTYYGSSALLIFITITYFTGSIEAIFSRIDYSSKNFKTKFWWSDQVETDRASTVTILPRFWIYTGKIITFKL